MSSPAVLRVCALYPSRMNIYADRGNLMLLRRRCEDRAIGFELTSVEMGDAIDPDAHDFFYIGGGQDSDQLQIAEDLVARKRDPLAAALLDDKVILAVCGGYQLLGSHYELDGRRIEGLGIIDLHTTRSDGPRLIGNIAIEVELDGQRRLLAGFENHGGRTHLGPTATPLGKVVKGHGNNGHDGFEGVRERNAFGTYLHGPLLPKNAWFADHLIARALRVEATALGPIEDDLERRAHACALEAAGVAAPKEAAW